VFKLFLSENAFFQLLSGIKVNSVDKMVQSNYLYVILHVNRKNLLIPTVLPDF